MQTGDGLLIRLRPPEGWLDAARLKNLANGAERWGNGAVDLTIQGRLQVRGLSAATLDRFLAQILDAGLASHDPTIELRRRVTLLANGQAEIAAQVEQALITSDTPLAEKFDVAVGNDTAPAADIMLHAGLIWLAGATRAALCPDPVSAVLRLVGLLAGRRMRDLQDAYEAAGLVADRPIPAAGDEMPGTVGVPFGRLTPGSLRLLAELGERYGDGVWRITRERALCLRGVDRPRDLAAAARAAGMIVDADDQRRRVSACPGREGCAQALTDTRRDALALMGDLPACGFLHVSGCAKLCGVTGAVDHVLVGTLAGYDVLREGVLLAQGLPLNEVRRLFYQ